MSAPELCDKGDRVPDWERERDELRSECRALREQKARLERMLGQARRGLAELMSVHVATERLHASLDRRQVLIVIEEVVASLVGCEQWALFELADTPETVSLVAAVGLPADVDVARHLEAAPLAETRATGVTWVAPPGRPTPVDEPPLSACIALKVEGRVTGSLALYRMLEHKGSLEAADVRLLEMLSGHMAVALAASRLSAPELRP